MHVTTAYMHDPKVATAFLYASLKARKALGLTDCSTGPERRIFDHLWRGKEMVDSDPETRGFSESWGLVASDNPGWKDVLHVDHWYDAQHVQRHGVAAESELVAMSRRDDGRRIWPVATTCLNQRSVGLSNAVKASLGFPWSGAGFDLSLGMSAAIVGRLLCQGREQPQVRSAVERLVMMLCHKQRDHQLQRPGMRGPPRDHHQSLRAIAP